MSWYPRTILDTIRRHMGAIPHARATSCTRFGRRIGQMQRRVAYVRLLIMKRTAYMLPSHQLTPWGHLGHH